MAFGRLLMQGSFTELWGLGGLGYRVEGLTEFRSPGRELRTVEVLGAYRIEVVRAKLHNF